MSAPNVDRVMQLTRQLMAVLLNGDRQLTLDEGLSVGSSFLLTVFGNTVTAGPDEDPDRYVARVQVACLETARLLNDLGRTANAAEFSALLNSRSQQDEFKYRPAPAGPRH